MSRRNEELKAVASEFCQVHAVWAEATNREHPDETYWDGVDDLRRAFGRGDIPDESRKLSAAVNRFLDQVDAFDNRENVNDHDPPNEFWAAREAIEAALSPAAAESIKPLESIAYLKASGVSEAQIAKMYGFRDRNGELMIGLVLKELDKPGSVLNDPAGVDGRPWVDPRIAERNAEASASEAVAAKAIERQERKADKPAKGKGKSVEKGGRGDASDSPPCHETAFELWQQGVQPKQAAKMLKVSQEEAAETFAGFEKEAEAELTGVGLDEEGGVDGGAGDAGIEGNTINGINESHNLADAGPGPKLPNDAMSQAIRELHDKGKTASEIVKELRCDPKKVKEAIRGKAAAVA